MKVNDKTLTPPVTPNQPVFAGGTRDQVRRDSEEGQSGMQSYIKELRSQCQGAGVQVSDLSSMDDILEFAKNNLGTFQIVITSKALHRMMSDAEFQKKCEELILQTRRSLYQQAGKLSSDGRRVVGGGFVLNEDGDVSQWLASEDVKQQRPAGHGSGSYGYFTSAKREDSSVSRFKTKDGKTFVFTKKLSYRPAKDLARLARASNQQMVKTTISGIRASIYQLKAAGGDKSVARQLVNQAEQVLLKARVKVKKLGEEALLESAQRKAEKQSQLKRAAYIRKMLEEQRTKRIVREYSQIRDHYPTPREIEREQQKAKEWLEQIVGDDAGLSAYASQVCVSSDLPISGGSPTVQNTGGVFIDISL